MKKCIDAIVVATIGWPTTQTWNSFGLRVDGPHAVLHFAAHGDINEIHRNLDDDGVIFHTLAPRADGADVYVVDMDKSAVPSVMKAAKRHGTHVTA